MAFFCAASLANDLVICESDDFCEGLLLNPFEELELLEYDEEDEELDEKPLLIDFASTCVADSAPNVIRHRIVLDIFLFHIPIVFSLVIESLLFYLIFGFKINFCLYLKFL